MSKARILVVEDDQFYIQFYRGVLEKDGYRVELARSIREAMQRLTVESYDLVIAELVIGGESGLDLLGEVKRSRAAQDILMVTSLQSVNKAVEALKMGASDYLTKPIDGEELLLAIKKIVDRQVVSQEHSKLISENIHFYELLRVQKKNLALVGTLDQEKLQDYLLDVLIQEMNTPGAILFFPGPEPDHFLLGAARGIFDYRPEYTALEFRTAGLRTALENGQPVLEMGDGVQRVPKSGMDEGPGVLLPILFRGELLGVVRLLARRGERSYGSVELDLCRNILGAAGLALKNASAVSALQRRFVQGVVPGTYEPSFFKTVAELDLSVARRYNRQAALVLLRIENLALIRKQFKESQVNQIVEHLCRNLLEIVRETDLLTRLDDDVFGIFIPETDYYGAIMLKKRIRSKLAKSTYPIDLKREMVPIFSQGCAACPRDGAYYSNLMEIARARLESEGESIFHRLRLDRKDIWGFIDHLAQPLNLQGLTKGQPTHQRKITQVAMTDTGFRSLVRAMIRDLSLFYTSRGILYLGVGVADPQSAAFQDAGLRENMAVSVFVLGAKGDNLWNLPNITPVFINDNDLCRHNFILGVTEHFSYGLFARPAEGMLRGFQTSDDLLVMELVSQLQDKYLLQRRIG
jgi:diguanylate cyclase (GGDEF)-like protein